MRVDWLRRVSCCHLVLLPTRGAHDKGRHKHDAPGGDDFEIVHLHFKRLIVKVRQAQAKARD